MWLIRITGGNCGQRIENQDVCGVLRDCMFVCIFAVYVRKGGVVNCATIIKNGPSQRACVKQGELLKKRFLTLEKQLRWTDSQGVQSKVGGKKG